ncbi:MAG TPA: flagellar biosynthesis repressor FlbT [Paracoccus sp. (in: a-proteobacteria)]|nr:flagellar biosynthesis repressor FlbT [Paracoccus sp. (in: a-proteobacteria)]
MSGSGLILKLAPGERVLINGAVIENGDRRARIAIRTPNVSILRLKEAIHPDGVSTPVGRVCHVAQTILSGDIGAPEGRRDLLRGIEQLSQVFDDRDSRRILDAATADALAGRHYQVLRQLRELLPREARLLAQVT